MAEGKWTVVAALVAVAAALGGCGGSSSASSGPATPTPSVIESALHSPESVTCSDGITVPDTYPSTTSDTANTFTSASVVRDAAKNVLVVSFDAPAAAVRTGMLPNMLNQAADSQYQAAGLDGTLGDGPRADLASPTGRWLYEIAFVYPGSASVTSMPQALKPNTRHSYKAYETMLNGGVVYEAPEYSDGTRVSVEIPLSKLPQLGKSFLWQFSADNGSYTDLCPANTTQSISDILASRIADHSSSNLSALAPSVISDFGRYPSIADKGSPATSQALSTTAAATPPVPTCNAVDLQRALSNSGQAPNGTTISRFACESGYAMATVSAQGESATAFFRDRSGAWETFWIGTSNESQAGVPSQILSDLQTQMSGGVASARPASSTATTEPSTTIPATTVPATTVPPCTGQLVGAFSAYNSGLGSTPKSLTGTITNQTNTAIWIGSLSVDAYFPGYSPSPGTEIQPTDDKNLQGTVTTPGPLQAGATETWSVELPGEADTHGPSKVTVTSFTDASGQPLPLSSTCSAAAG